LGTKEILRNMSSISEAVILMAGPGSRLRAGGTTPIKPLTSVLGRPLICYVLDALATAGITTVYAVIGFERESLREQLQPLAPDTLTIHFVENHDWQKQNGISVLAAARHVKPPFLLTMSDHLFDQTVIDLLLKGPDFDQLSLAIDRKIDSIFDLADAMKVQTRGDRIVAIGKELRHYDGIDTGLFVCSAQIFDYLSRAKRNEDCSLADGVRLMAADRKVRGVDIGDAWWQDVDTPQMLEHAARVLQARVPALPERR
jgi:1L-myo-inositol 1-phosphate cytidylyltransferase